MMQTVDPLANPGILAAPHHKSALTSLDSHLTINHYHHLQSAQGDAPSTSERQTQLNQPLMVNSAHGKGDDSPIKHVSGATREAEDVAQSFPAKKRRLSTASSSNASTVTPAFAKPPVRVKCMARTRIPTPHGPAFLHLYHNDRDAKEHLAMVIDPAQFSEAPTQTFVPPIRSQTLDAVWSETETEMDRITRGAYVGRLSPTSQHASDPSPTPQLEDQVATANIPAPLIRVHSECFTGETVGSMRCDCGEQLDEAIRRISQPITIPGKLHGDSPITIPGRGAVVYLRQEGRGIGLLSKIRAYNLQDLGHDTVTANLMLGHQADERGYEIAAAILHDLGLGGSVRVLTNNPDKVEALHKEGVTVAERVAMIPRSWQCRQKLQSPLPSGAVTPSDNIVGATMIGGNAVYGDDLDKYLRTKVTRMGHMLPLWMDEPEA